ncbi:hypothetical protein ACQPWY_14220 [Pseudonocardia xinjiangensis]|uniref:hypothetical protein n=1 Tax=Pseudonocardia xinjiangensis TaxID=75289 RepID=UPI003D8FF74A
MRAVQGAQHGVALFGQSTCVDQTATEYLIDLRTPPADVDVHHLRDSSSAKRPAALYRDGVQVLQTSLPVTFPVPGGVIEVAIGQYGVKRMHHVTDDGPERLKSTWMAD